jgi:hypothetical protein
MYPSKSISSEIRYIFHPLEPPRLLFFIDSVFGFCLSDVISYLSSFLAHLPPISAFREPYCTPLQISTVRNSAVEIMRNFPILSLLFSMLALFPPNIYALPLPSGYSLQHTKGLSAFSNLFSGMLLFILRINSSERKIGWADMV